MFLPSSDPNIFFPDLDPFSRPRDPDPEPHHCFKPEIVKGRDILFNTDLSSAPPIPLCLSILESSPGLLRLWHW
jgi:hypothetical protein